MLYLYIIDHFDFGLDELNRLRSYQLRVGAYFDDFHSRL